MPVTAVIGAQWGDEGKGKIVDLLASDSRIIARFGGGSNAGHTVVNEFGTFRLHSLPSGVFQPDSINIIGTGSVVDFQSLKSELDQLEKAGVPPVELMISNRAHVIMPYHQALDRLRDEARGAMRVGTTGMGVGPAYVDKADRVGIQAGDLLDPIVLENKLQFALEGKNRVLQNQYSAPGFEPSDLVALAAGWRDRFGGSITDTSARLAEAIENDESILAEGQLGVMRDIDWGTYPYVTSSTTFAAGAGSGLGIPPRLISDVVGVVKAYTSAVGEGPLPTELTGEAGGRLRELGGEYGATTGRPRRVGWLDGVALKFAAQVSGFTRLAVTKLDVLDSAETLKIAVAYEVDGAIVESFPLASQMSKAQPIYEEVAGWRADTTGARSWDDLPRACRDYLDRISSIAGAPVSLVGVGQARDATVRLT